MKTLPPVYRAADLRQVEMRAMHVEREAHLMARAGEAAAQYALEIMAGSDRHVLVLAGPGNNGGDAFEVATHLKRGFYKVDVVHPADPTKLRGDALAAWEKWRAADGRVLSAIPPDTRYDLIVDGLFGIGLSKPIDGVYARLIAQANAMGKAILALDIPSGLHSDTGTATGPAIRATHTITFIAHKPGLLTLDGPDHCGALRLATLGLDARDLHAPEGELLDATLLASLPLRRTHNFHKGNAGAVAIIGGTSGMVGATMLAARAALKLGAGKVYMGLLTEHAPCVDEAQPELMLRKPDAALAEESLTAIVAGPGMGTDSAAQRILSATLRSEKPLLLDADALNLVAAYGVLQSAIATRRAPTLITPHPAEAARLLEKQTAQIQADRIAAALALARKFSAYVLLKGNGSICASPEGRWWINCSGNPGMASAGMGDVLSGMVGGLLAQGAEPVHALLAAVHLHGAAADAAVAEGKGPIGLTAGELLDPARALLNRALT
ncbi:MAG TPA: NAD(P)H-hydrate dehydratase [Burkholderiales bacterium]|nr:NAD(P)H-hydrate dehydratase [Burkholderiales bacterium]